MATAPRSRLVHGDSDIRAWGALTASVADAVVVRGGHGRPDNQLFTGSAQRAVALEPFESQRRRFRSEPTRTDY